MVADYYSSLLIIALLLDSEFPTCSQKFNRLLMCLKVFHCGIIVFAFILFVAFLKIYWASSSYFYLVCKVT